MHTLQLFIILIIYNCLANTMSKNSEILYDKFLESELTRSNSLFCKVKSSKHISLIIIELFTFEKLKTMNFPLKQLMNNEPIYVN